MKYLRADIGLLRLAVAEAAAEYGLAPIAASTHPFARWERLEFSEGERYQALVEDLQGVSRRLIISGMHVHVGIEDPDLRIDLMDQAAYFLPHLLALSTSSPFWEGSDTGLKSYRTAVFTTLPRTGLPEKFDSWSDFQRHVDVLVNAGIIEDSSKVWWDIRPSERYPHFGDAGYRPAHEDGGHDRRRLCVRLPAEDALAAQDGKPSLAQLRQFLAVGELVAGPTIRDRRRN